MTPFLDFLLFNLENPITKRVDSSKQCTPVLTQRQALGDLSNTAIKPVQHGSKPVM